METGSLKIIIEEGKTPTVEAELVNGNVWMSKYYIARLFQCFNQKVEMNLRSIFKSKLLRESEVVSDDNRNRKNYAARSMIDASSGLFLVKSPEMR